MTELNSAAKAPAPQPTGNAADELNEEQRNVRNLVRVVSSFVVWPALSISLIMMLDLDEHILHIAGLFPLACAGFVTFLMAPKLARRWVPDA
jgi:hypothetical protein